jgi:hypothetical protein
MYNCVPEGGDCQRGQKESVQHRPCWFPPYFVTIRSYPFIQSHFHLIVHSSSNLSMKIIYPGLGGVGGSLHS